jgi:MFS family permease
MSLEKPTRVRYGVLGFACALSMITYLDRVCMGTVAPYMQTEFHLTDWEIGIVFGAFTLAYASFEVPTGWLGDRFGPRKTLIRIVLWWSVFTALTGMIFPSDTVLFTIGSINFGLFSTESMALGLSFVALLTVRFLFGLGEAGAYPNIARAFHNWFPFHERGFAKGAVWMAGRFGGGITPLVMLLLLQHRVIDGVPTVLWRHTFWIFGALGVIWCVCFWWWFRDRPDQKEGVNAAEIALIRHGEPVHHGGRLQVPWLKLLTSGNLWLLCGMYWCGAYGWYFNITFLPKYLKEQFKIDPGTTPFTAAWWSFTLMAGMPLLFGSTACLIGGFLTDQFIKRTGNRKWGRRLFGMLGHGLCAACYFAAIAMPNAWLFILGIALAAFWNDITMGASWASCIDIGGRYSGIVSGCMNTIGNLGGFMANIITGWVLGRFTHDIDKETNLQAYVNAAAPAWTLNFLIFGGVYVVAVFLWAFFDATKPVAPGAVATEEPLP